MANRDNYKEMLAERLENAYKAKEHIKPPTEVDLARWKHLAKARRKEKRKRAKIMASLASALVMVFCFSMVSMFQIPDAQAGEDGIVDIKDSRGDENTMTVEVYNNHEELPEEVREEFLLFDSLPADCELIEINIITIGEQYRYEGEFMYKGDKRFSIKQNANFDDIYLENSVVGKQTIEEWNGIEVYIREYEEGDKNILYNLVKENIFINIMSDNNIEKEVIRDIINGASKY